MKTLEDLIYKIQTLNAYICVPFMKVTGFRFSKDYRWGTTMFHKVVYALVNTVHANLTAGLDLEGGAK